MDNKKVTSSLIFIILFWAVSFFVLYKIFTREYDNGVVDIIYTLVFHIPLILIVSINFWIANKFLRKAKYLLYFLIVLILIGFGVLLHDFVFETLSPILFKNYYFISLLSPIEVAVYMLAYILISTLLFLSKSWFILREKQAQLERSNREIELSSLKSQLNPHFFFNSLNNIYSLLPSSDSSSRTYLLKLSDSLRYMLYNTKSPEVSIQEEIDFLKNYIELERLRFEESAQVYFDVKSDHNNVSIAPFLLFPIVENAFKYTDRQNAKIQIDLIIEKNKITFKCCNEPVVYNSDYNSGGIGLKNVSKRLELLYPGAYTWKKSSLNNQYISELIINVGE